MTSAVVERSQVRYGTKTIGYRIQRSSRRGTVSIAIDPSQGVLVRAPEPASIERLDDIVHAKASWIVRSLKRQSDLPPPPAPREFVSGETFLYLGKQYRLRVDLDEAPRPLRLDGGWLRVPIPRLLPEDRRGSFVRAALIDWYKARAGKRILERAKNWARKLRMRTPEVLLSAPQKRWGSASPTGVVRINWRVIQASMSVADYVLVHEILHLRHANHTRDFWAALGRVLPDYEGRKAKLRSLGPDLDW